MAYFDWLLGPKDDGDHIRSLHLDVEVIPDLAREVRHWMETRLRQPQRPDVELTTTSTITLGDQSVDEGALAKMDVVSRNALVLWVNGNWSRLHEIDGEPSSEPDGSVEVYVNCGSASVRVHYMGNFTAQEISGLRKSVINYLYKRGRALVAWRRLTAILAFGPAAVALASWVWLSLTTSVTAPAHLLIMIVVASMFVVGFRWYRSAVDSARAKPTGFRFRGESREMTQARRADHRRDIVIAIVSIAGTLLATLLAALLARG